MRTRDIPKLKTGDVVECRICPDKGCDGTRKKILVNKAWCGCTDYYHSGNELFFAWDPTLCHLHHGEVRFVMVSKSSARRIKLVKSK